MKRPLMCVIILGLLIVTGSSMPMPTQARAAATRPPAGGPARRFAAQKAPAGFVPGELLVLLDDDAAGAAAPQSMRASRGFALDATLTTLGLDAGEVLSLANGGARRFLRLRSTRADFDPVAAAAALRATGRYRAVIPNYRVRLAETLPNDPYLTDQWYIRDPARTDVHLPEAWDVTTGGTATVIGIMDTGVDTGHPDLASRIWVNPGEIAGNLIDDDGNGRIDDVNGWDFGNNDADPNPDPFFDENGIDEGFHGTFVAGIAAAETNNDEGIAGAGWQCRIMPLKVADAANDITTAAITSAFQYAAAKHVSVLNMSFGGPGDPGVPEYFQALVDMATAANVLCVASAGNDGNSVPSYPAACNNVLSVGATEIGGARSSFSSYGSWVKIAAPGEQMVSTLCRNYVFDDLSQIIYIYFFGWDGETPYMFGDGTSFSSPLVSGVAALVRSHTPSFTALGAYQQLITSGDAVAYDHPIGPKLNAYRAVTQPPLGVSSGVVAIDLSGAAPNPFAAETALRFTTSAEARVRLAMYDCAGRRVRELVDGVLGPGLHEARWDGRGDGGGRLASGVYFARFESGAAVRSTRVMLLH